MKLTYIFFVLYFFCSIAACKKEDGLTKETDNGANTFSCKVNGKIYIPKVALFAGNPIYCQYYKSLGSEEYKLIIGTTNPDAPVQHVRIEITGIKSTGTYSVGAQNSYYCLGTYELNVGGYNSTANRFETDNHNNGSVIISKLDTINKIVSGRFEFEATNTDNDTEIAKITSGRFDLKYDR